MVFFTCMYVHIGHDIYGLLTFYPATPREPSVISTVYQIKKIKAIFFFSLMIRGLGVLFFTLTDFWILLFVIFSTSLCNSDSPLQSGVAKSLWSYSFVQTLLLCEIIYAQNCCTNSVSWMLFSQIRTLSFPLNWPPNTPFSAG